MTDERIEAVAWAIAGVIAERRCDGVPAINDQRRAEARAAIAAMQKDAAMDRLVAEGQRCDAMTPQEAAKVLLASGHDQTTLACLMAIAQEDSHE